MRSWNGLAYATHRDVYEPHDDTYLLGEVVEQEVQPGQLFVEVGTGAGLVAMCAARAGAKVLATDRNDIALRLARDNARANHLEIEPLQMDLIAALRRADVVAFNPPYLPTADDEHVEGPLDWAFDGGLDGNQVVLRLVQQMEEARPAVVLIIHSSLSDPAPLDAQMDLLGYQRSIVSRETHFMETLTVRRYARF